MHTQHQNYAACPSKAHLLTKHCVCREVLVAATVEMKMLMDEVAAVEQQLRSSLGRGDLADLVAGMQAAEKEKLRMTVSLQVAGIFAHPGVPLVHDV